MSCHILGKYVRPEYNWPVHVDNVFPKVIKVSHLVIEKKSWEYFVNLEGVWDTGLCFRTIKRNIIYPILVKIWHLWEKICQDSGRKTNSRKRSPLVFRKQLFKGETISLDFKMSWATIRWSISLSSWGTFYHLNLQPQTSFPAFSQAGFGRSPRSNVPLWFKGQVAINTSSCSKDYQALFQVGNVTELFSPFYKCGEFLGVTFIGQWLQCQLLTWAI